MVDSAFDKRGDSHLSGSPLRNEAASYLESIHGNARLEVLVQGKKVDVVCTVTDFGKMTDLFVEVKDHGGHLGRGEAVNIFADYSPLLAKARSGRLLVVTRKGLAPGAQAYVDSQATMFHQTIWELEDAALGLLPYVRAQAGAFEEEGLSSYYVPARARRALYDGDHNRSVDVHDVLLFEVVQDWLEESNAPPLAILGGYGAGKSSFAKRLLASQAQKAVENPTARRPVLIKLGNVTRSAGLDGLLGSLFTAEFEVRGYSFRRFKELNEKGRLLIILDGFDEMKHAMTWTEFLNEIQELNALNAGQSKVVLLGRPSAFTSDDEHLEVLRGRRRTSEGATRRLRNWPEFREYELEAFTREERIDFVDRFLRATEEERLRDFGKEPDSISTKHRADEVNRLADQEAEVFGKPVHARILVELALDPEFDLASFAKGVTRWTLYSEFFSLLARRETKKPARSPIEAQYRLTFLRRIALWLWRYRDGATSFRAGDLPLTVLDGLPDGDTDTVDDKRREYLAGAFLERKANDTYFFPHRSFAEFLVAEHLTLNPPESVHHGEFDLFVRDGVAEFLRAAPATKKIHLWPRTLDADSGRISIEYLLFLADVAGGFDRMSRQLPTDSVWWPLVRILGTSSEAADERRKILADTILKAPAITNALLFSGLSRFHDLIPVSSGAPADVNSLPEFSLLVTAALITRTLGVIRESEPMGRQTVNEKAAPMLRLAQAAISLERGEHSRTIIFSWPRLADAAAAMIARTGPSVESSSGSYDYGNMPEERLPYFSVRELLNDRVSDFFHQMVLKGGTLNTISLVSHMVRRGGTKPS